MRLPIGFSPAKYAFAIASLMTILPTRMLRVEADAILFGERATAKQRNADGAKVLRVYRFLFGRDEMPRDVRTAFDVEEQDVARTDQRRTGRQRRGLDSWKRL